MIYRTSKYCLAKLVSTRLLVNLIISTCFFSLFVGCSSKKDKLLFTAIEASASGIDFENTIVETDKINLITNEYTYMGGGVGVGDFNNDNLPDLFFTANQTSSKLYVNEGCISF